MDGAVVLDKPAGITSHDAVAAARRALKERRIGHLGTLDPFATGVLVLLVGKATRLARFYKDREKIYRGTIRFGYSTTTFDSTGDPVSGPETIALAGLKAEALGAHFEAMVGEQFQTPPAFSAKKISGVPAYRLARKGKSAPLSPVRVTISALELSGWEPPLAHFRVRVSSGTYIRALAHALGERVGCGAHLAELRRTAVGEFDEAQASTLPELEERCRRGTAPLIALEDLLLEIPAVRLSSEELSRAIHGIDIPLRSDATHLRLLDERGWLQAIAGRIGEDLYHPETVLSRPLEG